MKPFGSNPFSNACAALYGTAVGIRNYWYDHVPSASHAVNAPVISIGGIHAGGSGKTPLALCTANYFDTRGYSVVFVSRGYGRLQRGSTFVRPGQEADWQTCGDEPAMLHQRLNHSWLCIGANRFAAIRQIQPAIQRKPIFILDDGFQHRSVQRAIDIVCLPANSHLDRLIPAGYLREGLAACSRAHIICLIGLEEERPVLQENCLKLQKRFPRATIVVLIQHAGTWVNALTAQERAAPPCDNPLLMCGIARPQRFITMVNRREIKHCETLVYNDHHIYTVKDINYIKSRENCDGIITTHKDAVRLKNLLGEHAKCVWYLSLELLFADTESEKKYFSAILSSINNCR